MFCPCHHPPSEHHLTSSSHHLQPSITNPIPPRHTPLLTPPSTLPTAPGKQSSRWSCSPPCCGIAGVQRHSVPIRMLSLSGRYGRRVHSLRVWAVHHHCSLSKLNGAITRTNEPEKDSYRRGGHGRMRRLVHHLYFVLISFSLLILY